MLEISLLNLTLKDRINGILFFLGIKKELIPKNGFLVKREIESFSKSGSSSNTSVFKRINWVAH